MEMLFRDQCASGHDVEFYIFGYARVELHRRLVDRCVCPSFLGQTCVVPVLKEMADEVIFESPEVVFSGAGTMVEGIGEFPVADDFLFWQAHGGDPGGTDGGRSTRGAELAGSAVTDGNDLLTPACPGVKLHRVSFSSKAPEVCAFFVPPESLPRIHWGVVSSAGKPVPTLTREDRWLRQGLVEERLNWRTVKV